LPQVPGYEVLRELGRGGMGVVYAARHLRLNRTVALKMLRAGPSAAPDRERFRQEAEAVARLQHPNVVQIFEVGDGPADGGAAPYLALEFVAGPTLDRHLAGRPLPPRAAAALTATLARAVHAAHRAGVIHRDLKPANILLAKSEIPHPKSENDPISDFGWGISDFTPKVTDFGLAKRVESDSDLTQTGAILGTPSYMAPEQAGGARSVGPAADVYALGVILYECLIGRPPFRGATALDTLEQVRSCEPVPPTRLQPRVPRDLETVCLKCLAKEPAKRYPSAAALADDLDRFLDGRPVTARRPSALERLGKFAGRNKVLVGSAAAVGLALAAAVAALAVGLAEARAGRAEAANANRELQRLLAESYAQQARQHLQRGEWARALERLDEAVAAGHPRPVALHLEKVRILDGLYRPREARAELEALLAGPDLGDLAAPARLWQAEMLFGEDDERAVRLLREALNGGSLSAADRAYAQGMLADDLPAAEAHFRAAVAAEPYHLPAQNQLVLVLLLQGQADAARLALAAARALFPEDSNLLQCDAVLASMLGEPARAEELLGRLDRLAGPRVAGLARAVGEWMRELRQPELWDFDAARHNAAWRRLVLSTATRVPKVLATRAGAGETRLHFPPFLRRASAPMAALWPPKLADLFRLDARIQEVCRAMAAVHADPVVQLLLGFDLFQRERWPEAAAAFREVVVRPSLLPVRRPALAALALTEWEMARQSPDSAASPAARQAINHLRQYADTGEVPAAFAQGMAGIAVQAREFDLARRLLDDWRRRAPNHPQPLVSRGVMEYGAGVHSQAIRMAREVLDRWPGHAVAKELLRKSQDGLRKQAADLAPTPPG
jgi:tetratricopeptide (TPR) repeat protein